MLATEEMLCRNALISGIPPVLGMCSQFVGEGDVGGGEGVAAAREDACVGEGERGCGRAGSGAGRPVLVAIGDGLRGGEVPIARSSGRESMGTRAMRVRVCRRGCCGAERTNRDRDGSLGSESGKGGRAENEVNDGAKTRGEWWEELGLEVDIGLDWENASGCVVVRAESVPKREYSGPEVLKSGSRSGTDASAERVRLWTPS